MNKKFPVLNKIREPETEDASKAVSVIGSVFAVLLGIVFAVLTQVLNHFANDSTVWWMDIVGELELNVVFNQWPLWFLFGLAAAVWSWTPLKALINEFLFFAGVIIGFHISPKVMEGIEVPENMKIWYIALVVAPILAVIFWYSKSKSWPSIIFDVLIIGIMGAYLFNCGFLYFHFNEDFIVDLLNMVIMLLIYILLGSGVIQLLVTLGGGVLLALALVPVI